jgi:cyd operon protein YbgT
MTDKRPGELAQTCGFPVSPNIDDAATAAPCKLNRGDPVMWYFTWILGVLLALAFGIINVMWMEAEHVLDNTDKDESHD